jgi:DNA-binding transcriptional MocR family regulator
VACEGLDLLARCLVDPGDTVIVDRPGYLGALHTFNAAGARVVGWDIMRHDLDEPALPLRYEGAWRAGEGVGWHHSTKA